MKLSKKEFVDIINSLKAATELKDNINELMKKAKDNIENDFMNGAALMINHQDIVVDLLIKLMNDTEGYIWWWIYDTNYGKSRTRIYNMDDSVLVDLKTAEILYDFLLKHEEC